MLYRNCYASTSVYDTITEQRFETTGRGLQSHEYMVAEASFELKPAPVIVWCQFQIWDFCFKQTSSFLSDDVFPERASMGIKPSTAVYLWY